MSSVLFYVTLRLRCMCVRDYIFSVLGTPTYTYTRCCVGRHHIRVLIEIRPVKMCELRSRDEGSAKNNKIVCMLKR